MLVRVQNAAGTNAERALIDWLRTWKDSASPHGVATITCSLFHKDRLHQFDAVIWTPTSCVVIEADALVARQDGVLEVPLNGPWSIGGEPIATESRDRRTPLDKSREHTFALQEWLAARGLGQRVVHGVALLVTLPGSNFELIFNHGRYSTMGLLRSSFPSSRNCNKRSPTNDFETDPISNIVSGTTRRPAFVSA
jgi:hypothetical protein